MQKIVSINQDGSRDLQYYEPALGLFMLNGTLEYRDYLVEKRVKNQLMPTPGTMGVIAADMMDTVGRLDSVDARSVLTPAEAEEGTVAKECVTEVLDISRSGDCLCAACATRVTLVSVMSVEPGLARTVISISAEKGGQSKKLPLVEISCTADELPPDVIVNYPASDGGRISVDNGGTSLTCILNMIIAFQADALQDLMMSTNPASEVVFGD